MKKIILTLLMMGAMAFSLMAQDHGKDEKPQAKQTPAPVPKVVDDEPPPPVPKIRIAPAEPCKTSLSQMPDIYGLKLAMTTAEVKKLYPKLALESISANGGKGYGKLTLLIGMVDDAALKALGHDKDSDYAALFFINDRLMGISGILKYERGSLTKQAAANRISGKFGLPSNWLPSKLMRDGALQMNCGDFTLIADVRSRFPIFMLMSLEMMEDEIMELLTQKQST